MTTNDHRPPQITWAADSCCNVAIACRLGCMQILACTLHLPSAVIRSSAIAETVQQSGSIVVDIFSQRRSSAPNVTARARKVAAFIYYKVP